MRSATRKKTGRDPDYLEFIRSLPCWLCELLMANGLLDKQSSVTEAAHVGNRGLSQKCPDREAIPLCAEHHREGHQAAHILGKNFWAHWGLVRDVLIEELNAVYESVAA